MKPKIQHSNQRKDRRKISIYLILTIILSILSMDMAYAFWQSDPRVPAGNHTLSAELAPAIGRLRKGTGAYPAICTGWIAQGGVLVTAEHCDTDWSSGLVGAIFEFRLASGMYIYRITAGGFTASKKLYLIK